MRFLIDTNKYSDFAKNDPETVERFCAAEQLLVPFVVIAELKAGFKCGKLVAKNEEVLARFLANDKVTPLYPDGRTVGIYAELFATLRRQGTPVPTNDLWIAALAVQHHLPLYTRDEHFRHFPHIVLI